MHACRINCNATNAFRPGLALQQVFHDLSIHGLASRRGYHEHRKREDPGNYRDASDTLRRRSRIHESFKKLDPKFLPRCFSTAAQSKFGVIQPNDILCKQGQSQDKNVKAEREDEQFLDAPKNDGNLRPRTSASDAVFSLTTGRTRFRSAKLDEIVKKKVTGRDGQSLEYIGQYVQPTNKAMVITQRLPWIEGLDLADKSVNPIIRLGTEIAAFAKWMRPTQTEIAAREAVIKQTSDIIAHKAKNFKVEPFGSARNGLALASSDVDLRIYHDWSSNDDKPVAWMHREPLLVPPRRKTRRENLAVLKDLQNVFSSHPDYMLCNLRFSRYPLLHMQHRPSGIDVQIVGANDTTLQRAWIKARLDEKPHLADLYAVLKTSLELRGLTDVFRGGLGSYAIFTLIVAALNQHKADTNIIPHAPIVTDSHYHRKLGADLLAVSRLCVGLDTYKTAVTVEPMALLPKLELHEAQTQLDVGSPEAAHQELRIIDKSQPYLLCLIDPIDFTNDLGRQAYGWKHIQETFKHIFNGVIAKFKREYVKPFSSFLGTAVGTSVHDLSRRRQRMSEYGKLAMAEPDGYPKHFEHAHPAYRKVQPGPGDDNHVSNSELGQS